MATDYGMDYLGALPAEHEHPPAGRQRQAHRGGPTPMAKSRQIYKKVARDVACEDRASRPRTFLQQVPTISISKNT